MITLEKVGKIYAGAPPVEALKNIDIELPECGMVFILGKSGSGKSTLLNILGGLDAPTSGTVSVDGRALGEGMTLDGYRNECVSFVFQDFHLNKALNAEQNVLLPERLAGRSADTQKSDRALGAVGLASKCKNRVSELSGGEKQRVAIARALIKAPRIILADEPTGKLDEANGEAIFDTLKKLSATSLIVVVSHDRENAERYADRIISLADGVIIFDTLLAEAHGWAHSGVDAATLYSRASYLPDPSGRCRPVPPHRGHPDPRVELCASSAISSTPAAAGVAGTLGLRDAVFLAYKNIASRVLKTVGTILICSMLFAVLGLSAILICYSPYGAYERTYRRNAANDSVIVINSPFGNYGSYPYRYGGAVSDGHASYLKENFAGYTELKRLESFKMPSFFSGSSFSSFSNLNGVFELADTDLASLGFRLASFENMPNVFRLDNAELIALLSALPPVPGAPPLRPDTVLPSNILYYIAHSVLGGMLGPDAQLPRPFSVVGEAERERILSFDEFSDADEARFPEDFWSPIFGRDTLSFSSEIPSADRAFAMQKSEYKYHEVAVSDFLIFVMYKRMAELFSPYYSLPLPEEPAELFSFLSTSGYEASVALMFNALAAFSGASAFRIAGIVDTGFKQKYAGELAEISSTAFDGNLRRLNVGTLPLYDDLYQYYLMAYAGQGFAQAFEGKDILVGVHVRIAGRAADLFGFFERENTSGWEGLRTASAYFTLAYSVTNTVKDMRALFIPIGILMLVVSAAGIAFFLTTAVTRKRKDIGVLKALGATTRGVTLIYILESLVTIVASAAASALLTFGLYNMTSDILASSAGYMNADIVERVEIFYATAWPYLATAAIAVVTGLCSTVYPVRQIARLAPVEAIQSE